MVLVKRRPPEYGAVSRIQFVICLAFDSYSHIDTETPSRALFSQSVHYVEKLSTFLMHILIYLRRSERLHI